MTISVAAASQVVLGNGVVSTFTFNIVNTLTNITSQAQAAANFEIIYIDENNVATTLSSTAYTLFLNPPAVNSIWGVGGTVTYPLSGSPIPDGASLIINRVVPLTQTTTIANQGDFYPQAVEIAIDTLCMEIQEIANRTGQFRGTWDSGSQYNVGDIIIDGAAGSDTGNYYMCTVTNTAGVWTTDLTSGDWVLFIDIEGIEDLVAAAAASAAAAAASAAAAAVSAGEAAASAVLAGTALTGTSTTTNTISVAQLTFTTQANKNFFAGQTIIAASSASPGSYVHGQVNSYTGTTLVIDVSDIGGSGTYSSWNISVSGTIGTEGPTGANVGYFIDQTPDNGTYGLLAGTVNGSNTVFTVSHSSYITATLLVWLNGVAQWQGASNDFVETTPASGTFTFNTAPPTNSIITAQYQTVASSTSGIAVKDEGITLTSTVSSFDFVGGGVTATAVGDAVTINVPAVTGGITQLTGDGTAGPGSGSQAFTLANNAVTTAKILNANITTAKIADANVTTAKIADANVTLPKLATQTARTVVANAGNTTASPTAGTQIGAAQLYGCNAAGTALGPITLGTGLSMTGTTVSANSGAMILISTQTPVAAATVDFPGLSSTYSEYVIVVSDLRPSTGADFQIRCSTNNGSSFRSTNGDYAWANNGLKSGSSTNLTRQGSGSSGVEGTLTVNTPSSTYGIFGEIKLFGLSGSQSKGCISNLSTIDTIPNPSTITQNMSSVLFMNNATGGILVTAVDAIRLFASSGTLTGTVKLYGLLA